MIIITIMIKNLILKIEDKTHNNDEYNHDHKRKGERESEKKKK